MGGYLYISLQSLSYAGPFLERWSLIGLAIHGTAVDIHLNEFYAITLDDDYKH